MEAIRTQVTDRERRRQILLSEFGEIRKKNKSLTIMAIREFAFSLGYEYSLSFYYAINNVHPSERCVDVFEIVFDKWKEVNKENEPQNMEQQ